MTASDGDKELLPSWRRPWRAIGPGVVSGAADDDPSAIATFTVAGAQTGTALLWLSIYTWPFMAAVQMMCARVGMATGRGVAGALELKFPRPLIVVLSLSLFIANTFNIGADLMGMADAVEMISGIRSEFLVVAFGMVAAIATVKFSYARMTSILKWLALSLFAYVIAALQLSPDWSAIMKAALVPRVPADSDGWKIVVGILGCTLSPYFFIWQASQEVEEKKLMRLDDPLHRSRREDFLTRKIDVTFGTLFSRVAMFFIILVSALVLNARGLREVNTSREAAAALEPLSGTFGVWLYTAGLVGVGLLVIPVLSGSAAYALAETFGWRQGLNENLHGARRFYAVIIIATLGGVAMEFFALPPVRALFISGVINGTLAPLSLIGILIVSGDRQIMHGQVSPALERGAVAVTVAAMLVVVFLAFAA